MENLKVKKKQYSDMEVGGYERTLTTLTKPTDSQAEIDVCLNCPFPDCRDDEHCMYRLSAKKQKRVA